PEPSVPGTGITQVAARSGTVDHGGANIGPAQSTTSDCVGSGGSQMSRPCTPDAQGVFVPRVGTEPGRTAGAPRSPEPVRADTGPPATALPGPPEGVSARAGPGLMPDGPGSAVAGGPVSALTVSGLLGAPAVLPGDCTSG